MRYAQNLGASYLWEFLLLQIFCDIWVKMLCIAFIETVYLSLLLNPDILVHKYELTDGLMMEEERMRKIRLLRGNALKVYKLQNIRYVT